MPPRLHPDRPQTGSERARRSREARDEYVAALELFVDDATSWLPQAWLKRHAHTIHRARASIAGRQANQD